MKNVADIYPLTPAQAGMLFHTLQAPSSGVYFEQYVCTLSGSMDLVAFQQAWKIVVERHAVLRTAFIWEGLDEPLQVVRQTVELPFTHEDWRGLSETKQHNRLEAYIQKDRTRGFDPAKAPLLRLALFQVAADVHQFVWSFHHLQLDGWSTGLLLEEVFDSYETLHCGALPTSRSPRPFKDYVGWLKQQDIHQAESFWKKELAGFTTPTTLRVDRGSAAEKSTASSSYQQRQKELSESVSERLQHLAQQHRLTLNTIFQGAWAILLSRYSSERDVLFGTTVSGRPADLPGVESMIGMFINTLPARIQVDPDAEILPWLKNIQSRQLELRRYEYSPLVEIQGWSDVPKGRALFDTIVVFENYPVDGAAFQNGNPSLEISNVRYLEQSNYPLSVLVLPGKQLQVYIIYNNSYFDDEVVGRLLGHLETILTGMTVNTTHPIKAIGMLPPAEYQQIVDTWNNTQVNSPQPSQIQQFIEQHATHNPGCVAVVDNAKQLTYGELDRKANQLAHYLQTFGVGPNTPVGLVLERSVDMIVAILGVLKAGGAYLPLDPAYPHKRLAFMLTDTQTPVIVTHKKLGNSLPEYKAKTVFIDAEWNTISQQDGTAPQIAASPENLAYIIYTSGSTGQPKGVPISHHNLVHSTAARLDYYPEPIESFLLLSSFAFDSSIVGIFGTLCQGGTLVLPPQDGEQDIQQITDLIFKHQVSHLLSLPSLYNLILTYAKINQIKSLRAVMVAGETCPKNLVDLHYKNLPAATLYNEYGPTEGTVWCTVYRVPADETHPQVPIGRPIANMQTYILGAQQQLLPIGVPGELYIGGKGLVRGYLNRPELTAEKFVPHPFSKNPAARLYRTGDLVRYLPDGNIDFLGRVDNQIKIRGYRVELDEIGGVMKQHPAIQDAVVITLGEGVDQHLVGYLAGELAVLPSADELRGFLQNRLPDYMVPVIFVPLDTLPLTPNGKVDRQSLPHPDLTTMSTNQSYTPPRNILDFQLTRIWEDVLKLERVGIHDNFFDLGGQSLLTVRLINEIHQKLDQKLPLAALFQAPTVAQLADVLRSKGWDISQNSLVTIQAGQRKKKPPLYLVPGNLGNVFVDLGLIARHLATDQPLYGLQDNIYVPSQVKAMATHYLKEIQSVQPDGPYLLGGICSGGVVAYEMAQQLERQGQDVALLVLVDAYPHENRLKSIWSTFQQIFNRLISNFQEQANGTSANGSVQKMTLSERVAFLRLKTKVITNMLGVARYTLEPYSGPIDVYFCEESLTSPDKPHLSWQRVAAGGIRMYQLPGTHNEITGDRGVEISEEVMANLARQLTERIDELLKET